MTMIGIGGIRKDYLLQHLYNHARPAPGHSDQDMLLSEARERIGATMPANFLSIHGRLLYARMAGDYFDAAEYDRCNGDGVAAKAVQDARVAHDHDFDTDRSLGVDLPRPSAAEPSLAALRAHLDARPRQNWATVFDQLAHLIADLLKYHCDPEELRDEAKRLYDREMGDDPIDQARWTERWLHLIADDRKASRDRLKAASGTETTQPIVNALLAFHNAHDALVEAMTVTNETAVAAFNSSIISNTSEEDP